MRVEKRINNNVVLAKDKNQQVIVMGKGVGFQVHPNDLVDGSKIERTYYAVGNLNISQMAQLILGASLKEIEIIEEIIEYGKQHLDKSMNESIFFSLLDHISFALKRNSTHTMISNPLEWEIKKFYPKEYAVGEMALKIIKDNLNVSLSSAETAFIALHFVNAQLGTSSNEDLIEITELTNEILKYVKYFYHCEFDSESFFYNRFLNHIQFYLLRQIKQEKTVVDDTSLLDTLKNKFEKEYECVDTISKYLMVKKGWITSDSEKMYLILHLYNLISKVE